MGLELFRVQGLGLGFLGFLGFGDRDPLLACVCGGLLHGSRSGFQSFDLFGTDLNIGI